MSTLTPITNNIYNLANKLTDSDVFYPTNIFSITSIQNISTSLFTTSRIGSISNGINSFTVNMQSIDIPGNTGSYYAIRVNTDNLNLYYSNINFSVLKLNS
jgi:hypothetical protein